MDIFFKEGVLSIILSIWAFTSPIIAIVKNRKEIVKATCGTQVIEDQRTANEVLNENRGMFFSNHSSVEYTNGGQTISRTHIDNSANAVCCPCISVCVLSAFMANWDDPVLAITLKDFVTIQAVLTLRQASEQQRIEGIQLQELSSMSDLEQNSERTSENLINASPLPSSPLKLLYKLGKENISIPIRAIKGTVGLIAMPTLVNYFIEANGDQTKIARLFTLGAPIFQELGINTLSLLNYASFISAYSLNSPKFIEHINKKLFTALYICWGLGSVIASYYYTSKLEDSITKLFLISVMTIRTFGGISCECFFDWGFMFTAGINLWYAVQNTIWALKGINVLDPNIPLWKPF